MLFRAGIVVLSTWALAGPTAGSAQEASSGWETLYKAGIEAEDYADYKKAEALLEQACTLAQAEPSPAAEGRACIALGRTYAVDEQYAEAESTLKSVATRLKQREDPRVLVEALFELADVLASKKQYEASLEQLKAASAYFGRLTPPERVAATARIGEMYLAVEMDQLGMGLIQRAQAELLRTQALDDAESVGVFADLGFVLTANDKHPQAIELLEPVVEAIEGQVERADDVSPLLRDAFYSVVRQLSTSYGAAGKKEEADAYREKAQVWRQKRPESSPDVYRIGDGVGAPRLTGRTEPGYTEGARSVRAQGTARLAVEIWPDGRAHNIRVLRYLPYGLTLRAIAAVRQWRFQPGVKDGEPVKVAATIEMKFRML